MDGVHDLGGMHGFGPAVDRSRPPPAEPFARPWEGRVHGIMVSLLAARGLPPGFRYAIERMGAAEYLTTSYYEHWLAAVETLVGPDPAARPAGPSADDARRLLRPFRAKAYEAPPPRFAEGDPVQVRRMAPAGHTRCPRYVRGVAGTVVRRLPATPLHDAVVVGDLRPEPCYTVAFRGEDLWGGDAEPGTAVHVDLWESYLDEPASHA